MNKSTVNFSSEEMEKSLSKLGSEISFFIKWKILLQFLYLHSQKKLMKL